jgi:PEP-CTERM motif
LRVTSPYSRLGIIAAGLALTNLRFLVRVTGVKTLKGSLVLSTVLSGMAMSAFAQAPVVGLYSIQILAGNNLIADQVTTGSSAPNTLDNVLTANVPNGATFAEFDTATGQLNPLSTFNATQGTWSIDYTFGPNGLGGELNSPSGFTATFGGNIINTDGDGNYTFIPPTGNPGTYLLSMAAPLGNDTPQGVPGGPFGTFQQVVGRAPVAGESVQTLSGITTFNGTTWDNGVPSLAIGQAAFYNLTVPEPTSYALLGMGVGALFFARRFRAQISRS